jgi:predicted aconitase with swiveling domain
MPDHAHSVRPHTGYTHSMRTLSMCGRAIVEGDAEGIALVSDRPISFLGGIDPESGMIIEKGHPLEGQSVAGRVLVFPTGKGSTVGSYIIYRLAKAGLAPCAIINASSEPIVAVGALISGIPMVDRVDIGQFETGMRVSVKGEVIHFG